MLKKISILFILIIMTSTIAYSENGYVSPEVYAVNEADLIDYRDIPPAIKPSLDNLDKPQRIQHPKKQSPKRVRKNQKPYEERMIYKMAKWWTSKTYKLQDPSHGERHEIKVKQRMEYEKQINEQEVKTKD